MITALAVTLATMNQTAQDPPKVEDIKNFYAFKMADIDGKVHSFSEYKGKVVLVVNVASACGNTKQYAGLQSLYQTHKKDGLVILGFPCNDFGEQEPGTAAEIKAFCDKEYGVTFPLFQKLAVLGPQKHKLYEWLTTKTDKKDIQWNFEKFLVGRDGQILKRFSPKTKPEAPEFVTALESALAQKSSP